MLSPTPAQRTGAGKCNVAQNLSTAPTPAQRTGAEKNLGTVFIDSGLWVR
jgi:hypothetical protein